MGDMEIEVFRAGKHTDSEGRTETWTVEDLDTIAKNFSDKAITADGVPLVLGHPKTNDPAFGWVKSVFRRGDSLWVRAESAVAEFSEWLDKKLFTRVSVRLDPVRDAAGKLTSWALSHVGFLGAAKPAVAGMAPFKLSADQTGRDGGFTIDFSTPDDSKSILERIFAKLAELTPRIGGAPHQKFPPTEVPDMDAKEYQAKIDALTKERDDIKSDRDAVVKKFEAEEKKSKDLEAKIATAERDSREKEYTSWIDKMIDEKKLVPAQKPNTLAMLHAMEGQEAVDFAKPDGTKEKKTPMKAYQESIENGAQVWSDEEIAGRGSAANDPEAVMMSRAEARANEKSISFGEALKQVRTENPDLQKQIEANRK